MKHTQFDLVLNDDGSMLFTPRPNSVPRITFDYWKTFRQNAVNRLFDQLELWFEGLEAGDEETLDLYDEDEDETIMAWTTDVSDKAWELAYDFMEKFHSWTKDKQAHEEICTKFHRKPIPESRLKAILQRLYGSPVTFSIDELREATTLGALIEAVMPLLEDKVKSSKEETDEESEED